MNLEIIGGGTYSKEMDIDLKSFEPARVIAEHKERYVVITDKGEMPAEVTGKLMHMADSPSDYPKTGDWVLVTVFEDENKAIIHEVLPRKTKFSRNTPGETTSEQVIAANIDCIFIVQGMDDNYNPARLQRYVAAMTKGITPVIVLNKSDIAEDADAKVSAVKELVKGAEIVKVSAHTGDGFDILDSKLEKGKTYAFLGSSGAGKSTIVNRLAGKELMITQEVREGDSKGRHTTTSRELFVLESGAMVIDTPGMRELQLWSEEGAGIAGFEDVEELAARCRFSDCSHKSEPGCAVRKTIENGEMEETRLKHYNKLQREAFHMQAKVSEKAAIEKKNREKEFGKMAKRVVSEKKRNNY